ncbi:MAG TPA: SDR family oxidoreductase [Candidatus Krumholzibacteria bacterium]|nr:SDR family oxidoreductase [Candidatus Krumholzibacteria bacterium]
MRIIVFGASGGTGREIVAQALERGYQVTAFVRRPEGFAISHERLSVVRGDVLDAASVEAAMPGHDAALCAIGNRQYALPSNILSKGTRHIVDAMETHGVRRFVCETSLGIGDSFGRLGVYYTLFVYPTVMPFYWFDKEGQEKVVKKSHLEWVIVRPGQLTNGRKRGQYKHGPKVGNYLWSVSISRADVADFMLNQLGETPYLRTAVGVCY